MVRATMKKQLLYDKHRITIISYIYSIAKYQAPRVNLRFY